MSELAEFLRSIWGAWLMLIFLGIIFWAYRPKNKDRFQHDAEIPLRDDQ